MKSSLLLALVCFCLCVALSLAASAPTNLRTDHHASERALGVSATPRFSWEADGITTRAWVQSAYQIVVATHASVLPTTMSFPPPFSVGHVVWDSGLISSNASANVEYGGPVLGSGMVFFWTVRTWSNGSSPSPWSAVASFTVNIDTSSSWASAAYIGLAPALDTDCPWFRRSLSLSPTLAQQLHAGTATALAYIGSAGYHELYVNGVRAAEDVLSPSTSDLAKRVRYRVYNISVLLQPGTNAIGVWLGPGWSIFEGVNPVVDFNLTKKPLFIGQLQVVAPDDSAPTTLAATGADWRAHLSTTRHLGQWKSSDFGGDHVDARLDQPGWSTAAFDDSSWPLATVYTLTPARMLTADTVEPTRKRSTVAAASVVSKGHGVWLATMQALFTGWIEIDVTGREGDAVTLQLSTNSGTAMEYNMHDQYVIGPAGNGTFCNRFSYHEIQFVTIIGLQSAPSLAAIRGYRVGTDRPRHGNFSCNIPLLNQIYTTTMYNYEGLTTGGMTVDCPHRERLGYGGDGHTSMEAALLNYPSQAFFNKWAQDWGDIQEDSGYIAHTAPTIDGGGGPGWSGFVVTMPWQVYLTYGDDRILAAAYPHMVRLLAFFDAKRDAAHILRNWGDSWAFLGDWLTPHGSEESSSIEAVLFNNCYVLYCTRIAARVAAVLGQADDAARYAAAADVQANAITKAFYNASTAVYLDSLQTHLVMPLVSGAVPEEHVAAVEDNLRREISVARQGHLDTGLHGTYFMTKYLSLETQNDLVLEYALQTSFPSYGFFLASGYTTWPEDWQGASSRMHGCYNAIGLWFQAGLLGIRPDPAFPGFRQFILRPGAECFQGGVSNASGSVRTVYGAIVVAWTLGAGPTNTTHTLQYAVTIPPNSRATLSLPARTADDVLEGGQPAARAAGVTLLGVAPWSGDGAHGQRIQVGPNAAQFSVGSGSFLFSTTFLSSR